MKDFKFRDEKGNRIGLIHYVFPGEETIYIDEDVKKRLREEIIKEFETLEKEVYEFVLLKSREFDSFLDEAGFKSGMGSIGYKK